MRVMRASTAFACAVIVSGGRVYKREGGHAEVFDKDDRLIAFLLKSDLAKFEREGGSWTLQDEPTARCRVCRRTLPTIFFCKNRSRPRGIMRDCAQCDKEREKHRPSASARQRAYDKRHPERQRAREAVTRAIKHGLMKRMPCEVCGDPKSHAHHDDYAKPLEVLWLCQTHHTQAHYGRVPLRILMEAPPDVKEPR